MKKLISTCIVLAILGITCQCAETVGVYQTEVNGRNLNTMKKGTAQSIYDVMVMVI